MMLFIVQGYFPFRIQTQQSVHNAGWYCPSTLVGVIALLQCWVLLPVYIAGCYCPSTMPGIFALLQCWALWPFCSRLRYFMWASSSSGLPSFCIVGVSRTDPWYWPEL